MEITVSPGGLALVMLIDGTRHIQPITLSELEEISGITKIVGGWLPPNTRYWSEGNGVATLVIEVPANHFDLLVRISTSSPAVEVKNVPLPAGLYFFKLVKDHSGYRISYCYLYALVSPFNGSLTTSLYLFPTPNVQTNQNICWGFDYLAGNKTLYKSLLSIEGAVSTFYSAAFNDHCFEKNRLSDKFDWGMITPSKIEAYFSKLRDTGTFGVHWLKPANKTVADVMREIGE